MKVLVVLSRFPWPLEKGDKLRAWYQLRGLAEQHEVHLVCLSAHQVSADGLGQVSFCKTVQVVRHPRWKAASNLLRAAFNDLPFQVNYFRSRKMKAVISETIQVQEIEACFVQLIRLGGNLPYQFPQVRWVLDYMDTFSIGMAQRVSGSGFLMRPFVASESRRLKQYEAKIAAHFDELVVISARDAHGLAPLLREVVHVIPNGVGEAFFEDLPRPAVKDFDLIFFGNMGYHPNVQSARFLVEEVLPILHSRGIRPRLCIVGARPASVIRSWEGPEIKVTGFVPDIRDYVLRSKVSVAPLVGGQGLQNKLLESMAMTMPTITSVIGNAGLGAEAGEDLIVCENANGFADAIERLLTDAAEAKRIAENGRRFVETRFRWAVMNERLNAVISGRKQSRALH
jgi:polysaccharide biosynthesis protein PslH